MSNWFQLIDNKVLLFFNSNRNPVMDRICIIITQFGMPFYWLLVMLALFLFYSNEKKQRSKILYLRLLLFTAVLISNVTLKYLFLRPRPTITIKYGPAETSPSFPSGHSSTAWAGATAISYTIKGKNSREIQLLIISNYFIAFLVSLSRMYIGVHYPSDVIAGALEAIILCRLLIYQYSWYLNDPGSLTRVEEKLFFQKTMSGILVVRNYVVKTLPRFSKWTEKFEDKQKRINQSISSFIEALGLKNPETLFFLVTSILIILSGMLTTFGLIAHHFKESFLIVFELFMTAGEEANEEFSETVQDLFVLSLIVTYLVSTILSFSYFAVMFLTKRNGENK